jgi:hypothetical protein
MTEEAEELAGLLREKGYPDDPAFVSRVLRTSLDHGCSQLIAADLIHRGVQLSGRIAGMQTSIAFKRPRVEDGAAGGAGGAAGGAGGAAGGAGGAGGAAGGAGGAGGAAGGAGGADDSSESADDCAGSFLPAWTYQESAESTDESAAAGSMQSAQRDASAAQAGVLIMLASRSFVFGGSGSLPSTAPPPNTPQTPPETVQSAESADASADDSSHADEDSSESADDSSGEGQREERLPFRDITNRKH